MKNCEKQNLTIIFVILTPFINLTISSTEILFIVNNLVIMANFDANRKLLEKILSSQEFSSSKIYQSYLTYLVEALENEKSLKEATIAIDVFGRDSDFNPAEDTIVRSHTYTLRKKLDNYYLSEGKEDRTRLEIPKGHYDVQFVPVEKKYNNYTLSRKNIRILVPWLISLVLIIFLVYMFTEANTLKQELSHYKSLSYDDPIWKDFIQSDLPVMIVPGDHIFYTDYFERFGRELTVRDYIINSEEELDSLSKSHPQFNIRRSIEPYFPYHSLWSLPPVLFTLFSGKKQPILRKSSDISPQILDEYNFIFIGSIKTLYIFKHTLSKSNFSYQIAPHKINYQHPDSNYVKSYKTNLHSEGLNEDLVLALKLPGPANNSILIIASYHSLGAPEIANILTDYEKRQELERIFQEKFGKVPQYFEILFRVTGIDKTAYSNQILICNEIHSDRLDQ